MEGLEGWGAPRALAIACMGLDVLAMAVLGARLLVRFLRSGAPTGFIGIALLLGGAPCHVLFATTLLAGSPESRGLWQVVYAGFYVTAGIAAVSVLRFAHEAFRPRSRVLSWVGTLVAVYFAAVACTLPFAEVTPREHPARLGIFAILFAIFGWSSFESFRAWARYRRVPGLDPVVVESFRLWGLAALAVVGLVGALRLADGAPGGTAAAGLFGLACCGMLWLAFLPPEAWRRRLGGRAGGPAPFPAGPPERTGGS